MNAIQVQGNTETITKRLTKGIAERGGVVSPQLRTGAFSLGSCVVSLQWGPAGPGLVQVSYGVPTGCEAVAEAAEIDLLRMLDASNSGGASWKLPALVALVALGVGLMVWGRGRR